MDTTVTHLGGLVVAALRSAGYAESTIGQYEKTIRALDGFIGDRGGAYTSGLGAVFASLTTSPRTGRFSAQRRFDYTRLVSVFDTLIDTGEVPLQPRKRGGGGRSPVSDAFIGLDTAWEAEMLERGLAPTRRVMLMAGSPAATWYISKTRGSSAWMTRGRARSPVSWSGIWKSSYVPISSVNAYIGPKVSGATRGGSR